MVLILVKNLKNAPENIKIVIKKGSIHINVRRTGTHVTYGYINKRANLYDISEINRTKILIFF